MNLSQVLRGAYRLLGLAPAYTVSGGSTTTAVIGRFANEEQPPEEDFCLNWTLFVDEADGAAPEGEFGNISDYNGGTYTVTVDTLTAAIASGDRVLLAKPTVSLADMIAAVNTAITELQSIPLIDTSITLDGEAYEYSLPANIVRVADVHYIPTDGTTRYPLTFSVIPPATVSGVAKLHFSNPPPAGTAYITYEGTHAGVNAYNDTISPTIPLQLLVAQTAHCALRNVSQQSPLWQEKYNLIVGELNAARTVKKQVVARRRNSVLDLN